MRIILGKSSGSANNGNNTTDFGSVDSNNAASGTTATTNRVSLNRPSSPTTGVVAYSTTQTSGSTGTTHFSETNNPTTKTTTQSRKRKNSGVGDFLDCKKPAILYHQKQQPLKLAGVAGTMVSPAAKPKPRPNSGAAAVETTTCVAPSTANNCLGTPTIVPQPASRTIARSDEDFQQQLGIPQAHAQVSNHVVDENEPPLYPAYDPNNPAADDEEGEEMAREDVASSTKAVWNVAQSKIVSSSISQRKMLQQQYLASSSSSSSGTYSRNSNTKSHTKETPSTVALRKDKEFASLMKKQLKFDIVEMDGDGNCLFRAVALQVFGDVSMHTEVRRRCLEFMAKNEEHYSQFLTDEESFPEYIRRKSMNGVHGNHVEIQAISELYNRPIEMYTPENGVKPINIFHTEYKTSDHPIRLSYHDGNHYNAVIDPFCPTAGLGLGLPGLQPGLADEMQLKEALSDSDRLELDRLYVEKAIRDSEECYMDQFYKEKALALSDLEQTDFDLEQAIIQSSLESSNNIKQPRRSSPSNTRGSLRNRMSTYTEDLYSETSTSIASAGGELRRSSTAAASGSTNTIYPSSGMASSSFAESRFENPAADDGVFGAIHVDALAANEYPDSVTELVMNGFELQKVLRAYELVGNNFDDLLAILMNSS